MSDYPTLTLSSGAAMPLIGFGTWQITGDTAYDAVRWALEAGYRHLDTATMYGNEAQVGRALKDSGVPREDVFVTTKLPPNRAGDERAVLDASLRELGVDALDLWLIHAPPDDRGGVEVWKEFVAARDDGLVRDIGVSNYSAAQVDALIEATGTAPAVNQVRWSPWLLDTGLVRHHADAGVVLEGYSPIKTSDLDDPTLGAIAQAHGVSPVQVVLRWHVDHGVVVIPKSTHRDRIESNFAITDFSLSADELASLDALG